MKTYKFVIDGQLSNLNDYIRALNISKFKGAELKRNQERLISIAIKNQLNGVKIINPVRVKFNWIEPNAKRDIDNIAFAKKFILDALANCGTIQNDTQKHVVGFTDSFWIDKNNPRIEVTLEVLEVE